MWLVVDWLALLVVVAVVYVLVRPGSKAAEAIDGYTSMIINIVKAATDIA
jgi:hypothetical protein